MRVLVASGIDGFCHRYAALHWAEQLATQGIASTVRAHGDARLAADLVTHDVLVLYRVPDGAWVRHLLGRARALGRATLFAVDDLIFDPALREPPPLRRLDDAARRLWHDGIERYRRTLLACDTFLATSEPLVAAGRAAGKRTYLHRCGLAARELALGAVAAGARRRADGALRLGYFSGTATHDDDLATIAPVVRSLLERHPSLTLVVGGLVAIPATLATLAARIERVPLVPWPELPAHIAGVDVNLAPLEWRDPFVAAKGAVKYLEAAAVGVPTVASPSEAFRHATRNGDTGLLAGDAHEWEVALASLIGDELRRLRVGAAARADVATRFAAAAQGRELRAILEDVVAHAGDVRQSRADAADRREPRDDGGADDDELALARRFPGEVARAAREPDGLPDHAAAATTVTPPLGDGVVLAQGFRARRPGLARVDVHTVTYGLALEHTLEMRLVRRDGSVAASSTVPAAVAPDRDWLALAVPPEPDSADRSYILELRARGTGPRNALAFGAAPPAGGADAEYVLDGVAADAALTLRTFAADGSAAEHRARRA